MLLTKIPGYFAAYTRAELLYNEPTPIPPGVDYVRWTQWATPIPGVPNLCIPTLAIDLTQDADAIFAGFKKDCRNEIRRAERDGGLCHEVISPITGAHLADLAAFYRAFAAWKAAALGTAPVPANMARLRQFHAGGNLLLSRVRNQDGQTISWHSFQLTNGRARLVHAPTPAREYADTRERAAQGRATRWHVWQDIRHCTAAGTALFDFGDAAPDVTDPATVRVRAFKAEFGPDAIPEYHADAAVSRRAKTIGRLDMRAQQAIGRLRHTIKRRRG